jgi:hypothetical protein
VPARYHRRHRNRQGQHENKHPDRIDRRLRPRGTGAPAHQAIPPAPEQAARTLSVDLAYARLPTETILDSDRLPAFDGL